MNVLALEPYYGGSHRAFLDGWSGRSRHEWTILSLPDRKWKWRMRHSAITLNEMLSAAREGRPGWDVLFCSDMLNLAEFVGLAEREIRDLPRLLYFHENQVTYPVEREKEFDYHFAFSNLTSALAADTVWFNSDFHRESFLRALRGFLTRMPDHRPLSSVEAIREVSAVRYPGIEDVPPRGVRRPGPVRLLWAARWEYDKRPDLFFDALRALASSGVPFEVRVVGGVPGGSVPDVFERAQAELSDCTLAWGYLPSRRAYIEALLDTDIVVSTADHEFFGLSVVEACRAGALPIVPRRLAYPEVLRGVADRARLDIYHDGSAEGVAARIREASAAMTDGGFWRDAGGGRDAVSRYLWDAFVPDWDDELERLGARDERPGSSCASRAKNPETISS